ncbi:hypothetical protein PSNVIR_00813 [Pseudomonas sp. Nvir]|nr:hypothetical protein PSNVIR_00813 [Pseudomonas sp. Nvir]
MVANSGPAMNVEPEAVATHPRVEPVNSHDLPATNGWVAPTLFLSWVISLLWLVRTPSALSTRLPIDCTAEASAFLLTLSVSEVRA